MSIMMKYKINTQKEAMNCGNESSVKENKSVFQQDIYTYISVSSAYMWISSPRSGCRESFYKRCGPRTEPCGTDLRRTV